MKNIKPGWLVLRHFDVNDIYIDFIQIEMNIIANSNWKENEFELNIKGLRMELNIKQIQVELKTNWNLTEFESKLNWNQFELKRIWIRIK